MVSERKFSGNVILIEHFYIFFIFPLNYTANEPEHEKVSKKELLIGRRKEKKDKKCYAALGDDDEEEPLAGEASSR